MKSIYFYTILALLTLNFCSCKNEIKTSVETKATIEERPTYAAHNLSVIAKDSLVLNPNNGIVYHHNIPFTGISQKRYPSGQESISIQYDKGIRNGKYTKWFEDGSISYLSEYINGKQNGTSKSWWRNGNLRSKNIFVSGLAHGQQEQWYKSGAKFKLMNMTNGREEGMQKSWRENGKIYNNYEARDGRIFGLKRAALCFQLDNEKIVKDEIALD